MQHSECFVMTVVLCVCVNQVRESNRKVFSMVNPTASTADVGPAVAALLEHRTVMPTSASAVYPATSAWDPGPRPVVVGSRPGRVSRPSIASSLHGSLTMRYLELSCSSSVLAPLPAAAAWAADPDHKVSYQLKEKYRRQLQLDSPRILNKIGNKQYENWKRKLRQKMN